MGPKRAPGAHGPHRSCKSPALPANKRSGSGSGSGPNCETKQKEGAISEKHARHAREMNYQNCPSPLPSPCSLPREISLSSLPPNEICIAEGLSVEGGGLFCPCSPSIRSTPHRRRPRSRPNPDRRKMYGFEALTFNIHGGYLEAIVRGHRASLLTAADYNNLCQCETLDDIKMHLSATEYGPYLQNEPSPLHTTTIVEKCTLKLVDEYKQMLCQATEPLSTFLEYITYGHMIDNVVLIVTGTLHERDVQELLEKCHPLGMFDSIATLAVAQNMRELYRLVLVDTPLAPYFSECITSEDLDDMNIEIMRNTLYKAYLEDFYRFCQKLGGATAEIMSDLLAFEADRRAVNITINSIGTELTRDDRKKLYSSFGLLYPYGHEELAVCEDIDQVRGVMEKYPPYQSIFSKLSYGESQMLDKAFYEEEVKRLCLAFEQQFHYGVFFAYMRLREQEIRNLMWISECVAQNQKSRVHDSVVFIF
ncbi:hypothetical protein NL676_014905 [Syzygium grande]|nr:hypothetical protein NL676_014905 [Syzygium grande]